MQYIAQVVGKNTILSFFSLYFKHSIHINVETFECLINCHSICKRFSLLMKAGQTWRYSCIDIAVCNIEKYCISFSNAIL